jgi:uncharacterized protein
MQIDLDGWEARFEEYIAAELCRGSDSAHDLEHTRRVVANARMMAGPEGAALEIVVPAAWLHDCVQVPKDSDRRAVVW